MKQRKVNYLIIALVLISISITLLLIRQKQDNRSSAAAADQLETEGGVLSASGVTKQSDSQASGGEYVAFANQTPTPTPTPNPSGNINWPVQETPAIGSAPILRSMNMPGYLQWATDPRTVPPPFPAGSIQTEITRISDAVAFGLPTETFFKMGYAKRPAWNSDNSLMMIFRDGGAPGHTRGILLDGKTFAWKKNLNNSSAGGRWSNTEPTKFYNQNGSLPQLEVTDVNLDNLQVVRSFTDLGYTTSGGASIFGGEGRQSNDDRYWPLQLGKANGEWDIVIYDKVANSVAGIIPLSSKAGSGTSYVDNWGMSQNGQFVVMQTISAWTTRSGVSVPVGVNVFSPSGQYLRSKGGVGTSHIDYGIDASGNEVVFFIGSKYGANDKVGQTWRLDGADGSQTVDQFKEMIGWSYHVSTAHTAKPGWAIVTSDSHAVPSNYNWAPMWNHIFAVKLDGSLKIYPIANLHHANTPVTVNDYGRQSFGVANRDMSAVLWGGTWGDADVLGPIHSFVARPKLQ